MIFLVAHVAGHMVKVLLFELKIALRFADSEKGVFNCLLSTGALCVIMRHCSGDPPYFLLFHPAQRHSVTQDTSM